MRFKFFIYAALVVGLLGSGAAVAFTLSNSDGQPSAGASCCPESSCCPGACCVEAKPAVPSCCPDGDCCPTGDCCPVAAPTAAPNPSCGPDGACCPDGDCCSTTNN